MEPSFYSDNPPDVDIIDSVSFIRISSAPEFWRMCDKFNARARWYAGPLHDYRFYLANKTNLMGEAARSFDAEEFLEEFRFGTLEDAVKDKTPMTSILCAKLG